MEMYADPESLPPDVWRFVYSKLHPSDRIRLRAASHFWRSVLPRQPPWLLIVQQDALPPPLPLPLPRCGLASVGDLPVREINFPDLDKNKCIGSQGNWLVTEYHMTLGNRFRKMLRLFNPFTLHPIPLPSPSPVTKYYTQKIILSSSPHNGRECIVMSLQNSLRESLAFARLGDTTWTTVQFFHLDAPILSFHGISDIVFYKGHFYAINHAGMLMICHNCRNQNPSLAFKLTNGFKKQLVPFGCFRNCYLVEWVGELLLVVKWREADSNTPATMPWSSFPTRFFAVYKFDFISRKWNELKSLGEHSIFLGSNNTSVSVWAAEYIGMVKNNCIYFTDDMNFGSGGYEIGVYDLEDKSIKPVKPCFSDIPIYSYKPPVWMVPS